MRPETACFFLFFNPPYFCGLFFLFCFAVLSPSTPTLCEHPMSSAAIWANKLWPAIPHTQWGASGEKCSCWTHGQNMANRDQSRRSWGNRKAKPFNWIKDKAATMKCQGNALRKCQLNSANIQLNILKNHLTLLSDALLIFLTNLVTIFLVFKNYFIAIRVRGNLCTSRSIKSRAWYWCSTLNHFQIEFFDGTIG